MAIHQRNIKAGVINTQIPGQPQCQRRHRRGNRAVVDAATLGHIVVEALIGLGSPVSRQHLIANHNNSCIPVQRQVFLGVEHVSALAVAAPVLTGFNQPDAFAHAGLGKLCHERMHHGIPDHVTFHRAVGLNHGPGRVLRGHRLECTGHLHFVVADAVAGFAGKHPALETVNQGI